MIRELNQLSLELVLMQLILDFQENGEYPEICLWTTLLVKFIKEFQPEVH